MDAGFLKMLMFFVPVIGFVIYQIISVSRSDDADE